MSTILDALRKAQEETGSGREVRLEEVPAAGEPPAPRRRGPRRLFGWLAAVLGVLAVAFVGGLALGNRVSDLFGRPDPQRAAPAAPPEVALAERTEIASAAAAGLSAVDETRKKPVVVAEPAARPRAPARAAADDEPVPTPYGQLHVFGAPERPTKARAGNEDRSARLQELRERMLKQRRELVAKGAARSDQPPVAIVVPPPRDPDVTSGADSPTLRETAPAPVDGVPAEPGPEAIAAAPAPAGAPLPRAAAVGVSIGNTHEEQAEGEIRDPDIAMPDEVKAPAAEEQAPTTVAALPPQTAPPPAAPPVLRRAPGGAPQVSINILQWSAQPERRFAFVSVDGGGMTQVREGDRIGGLTVKHIHQQMIEFGFNDSSFLLRAN